MDQPIRLLLVEDHPVMSESLKNFFSEIPGVRICGAAATGEEGFRLCCELGPEIALIDVSLPGMSGLDLAEKLHTHLPGIAMLMLSCHREITYINRARSIGARGYVLKGDPDEIIAAINEVNLGGTYFAAAIDKSPKGARFGRNRRRHGRKPASNPPR